MTIAGLPPIHLPPSQDAVRKPEHAARVSFRQPVSTAGFVDAAWWPRSRDLTAELPPLLDVLWTAAREIIRITYNTAEWNPAPRRMVVEGRTVRLGGFTTTEPHTARLSDAWGQERIDILIITPDTDPATAQRILLLASQADNPHRAREILIRASSDPVTFQ
jgi:hypothetical protein